MKLLLNWPVELPAKSGVRTCRRGRGQMTASTCRYVSSFKGGHLLSGSARLIRRLWLLAELKSIQLTAYRDLAISLQCTLGRRDWNSLANLPFLFNCILANWNVLANLLIIVLCIMRFWKIRNDHFSQLSLLFLLAVPFCSSHVCKQNILFENGCHGRLIGFQWIFPLIEHFHL